jgi:hypothetical protein
MNAQVKDQRRYCFPYYTQRLPPLPVEPHLPTASGKRWEEFSHPPRPSFHQRLPSSRIAELRRCAPITCNYCRDRNVRHLPLVGQHSQSYTDPLLFRFVVMALRSYVSDVLVKNKNAVFQRATCGVTPHNHEKGL